MVNVHGGGFYWFSSSPTISAPDYLIERNVVVVTFNYRLSVLGEGDFIAFLSVAYLR